MQQVLAALPREDVLIVDDDPGTLATFAFIVRTAKLDVRVADSGLRAIGLSKELPPALVICDLRLPDIAGLEVLRQMRSFGIKAVFVVMTGFPATDSAMAAGQLGVVEYLVKPIFEDVLLSTVQKHAVQSMYSTCEHVPTNGAHHVVSALKAIDRLHMDPDLNLRAVADGLAISPEHLCRLLKKHTGCTFGAFLCRTRLTEAARLLETTTLSVKEVSARVGFRSASHFDRAFKSRHSTSPTLYRTKASGRIMPRF